MKNELKNVDDGVDLSYDKHQQHHHLFEVGRPEAAAALALKPESALIKQEAAIIKSEAALVKTEYGVEKHNKSMSSLGSSISAGRLKFFKGKGAIQILLNT
jgi:hypothetical protein